MPHLNMDTIVLGNQYDSKQLADIWNYKNYNAIRKGILTEKESNLIILMITRVKQQGATEYEDHLEGNVLSIMGQTKHGNDARIARNKVQKQDEFHLFYREIHHTPFTYYGKCELLSAELHEDKPSNFKFLLLESFDEPQDADHFVDYILTIPTTESGTGISILVEGTKRFTNHIRYERNRKNRIAAIMAQGHKCKICGFDFDKAYGEKLADGFIEVHHIKQLSEGEQRVDPEKDLIPVCANCHRMLHRKKTDNITISELQDIDNVRRLRSILSKL